MRKILIVDDLEELGRMVALYLRRKGFDVHTALSAEEALKLLRDSEKISDSAFDLVITDNSMPGMRGIELIPKIKELYPSIKTILMSGDINLENQELPSDYFIPKPFDCDDLLLIMLQLLLI